MVRVVRDGKERYTVDWRKTRENVGPLQKEMQVLVTWDMEKTELFNDFLPQCSLGSAPAALPKLQKAKAETEKMKNQLL